MNIGGRANDEKERRCDKDDRNRTENQTEHLCEIASVSVSICVSR